MRISEILSESLDNVSHDYDDQAAIKIADFIKKNCQPWLAATEHIEPVLYRGVEAAGKIRLPQSFIKPTRTDRKPMTTDPNRNDIFNMLIGVVGGKANRNNSIFCTSDASEARMYGPVFVVMPIGNFNYTWSPEWFDWTLSMTRNDAIRLSKGGAPPEGLVNPEYWDPELVHNLIKADEGLEEAIRRKHEIMISCGSALYVGPNFYKTKVLPLLQS